MARQRLKRDNEVSIRAGDEMAIEYYQSKYIANGIELFD